MSPESIIQECLLRWQESCEQGREAPLDELCRDHPELTAEVARRVEALRKMRKVIEGQADALTLQANETPAAPMAGGGTSAEACHLFAFLAPPQSKDEIGRLAQYRLLELLGAGGMGMVFLAEDTRLKRRVALKTMKPSIAAMPGFRERFLLEAQAAAMLDHENILTIFEVGEDRGIPFIAARYLSGESLDDRLKNGLRCSAAEVLNVARQVASGLAAAHAKGFIHRDIKPSNIWLEASTNRAYILDFGLARLMRGDVKLTQSGVILGTPAYMAPEQARGAAVDARSDLFSLGIVLYQMCTGRLPFQGQDALAILHALANDSVVPPHELAPDTPPELSELILGLLEKDPDRRLASANVLLAALDGMESLPTRESAVKSRSAQTLRREPGGRSTHIASHRTDPGAKAATVPDGAPVPDSTRGAVGDELRDEARSKRLQAEGVPSRGRPKPRVLVLGIVLLLCGAAVLAVRYGAVLVRLAANEALLKVRVPPAGYRVTVLQEGQAIAPREGLWTFVVKAGDVEVQVWATNQDKVARYRKTLSLHRGEEFTLDLRAQLADQVDASAASTPAAPPTLPATLPATLTRPTKPPDNTKSVPTPPAVIPPGWHATALLDSEWVVAFPAKPQESRSRRMTRHGEAQFQSLTLENQGGCEFVVQYFAFLEARFENLPESARMVLAVNVEDVNGVLESQKPVSGPSWAGIDAVVSFPANKELRMRLRLIVTERERIVLFVVGPEQNVRQEAATKFLESFGAKP